MTYQVIAFACDVGRRNDHQRSKQHSIEHSVQPEIDDAVNCGTSDSNHRGETCSSLKFIPRLQIPSSLLQYNDYKPADNRKAHNPTTRENLKIIVVRLLRRHSAWRDMVAGNCGPVTSHSYTQDRIRLNHRDRRTPDL